MPRHNANKKQSAARDSNGRFIKGQSGNPAGTSGLATRRAEIREIIERIGSRPIGDKSMLEKMIESLFLAAIKGNAKSAEILLDRQFGKPQQAITHSGDPDNPLVTAASQYTDEQLAAIVAAGSNAES